MDFNSIKVRLELVTAGDFKKVVEFQFHKGTIRTQKIILFLPCLPHFNSIKVRLEP